MASFNIGRRLLAAVPAPVISAIGITFRASDYVMTAPLIISTGVRNISTKAVVRTISGGVRTGITAMLTPRTWDGKDEEGNALDPSLHERFVVASNMQATWEGTIGNTADSFTQNLYRGIRSVQDFEGLSDGSLYTAMQENEGQASLYKSAPGKPNSPVGFVPAFQAMTDYFLAHDATYVYRVSNNSGWDSTSSCFVRRNRHSDGVEVPFSGGSNCLFYFRGFNIPYANPTVTGVLGLAQSASPPDDATQKANWYANAILGMALTANYIILTRSSAVQFYDINTGALVSSTTLPALGQVSVFAGGTALALVTNSMVKRYSLTGTTLVEQNTYGGLTTPSGVSCHPTSNLVLITDAAQSKMTISAFADVATVPTWTYGQVGGYSTNGPLVTNDKFMFVFVDYVSYNPNNGPHTDEPTIGGPLGPIKWMPDGTFWVGDQGNQRSMHYAADRTYLGQMAFLADRLVLGVDINDPRYVYNGMLRFSCSLSPLTPGDQSLSATPSWKLTHNYAANGWNALQYYEIRDVVTHNFAGGNGRTYAHMADARPNLPAALSAQVEITDAGLRVGPIHTGWGNNEAQMHQADGSLRTAQYAVSPDGVTLRIFPVEQALSGYGSDGFPLYAANVSNGYSISYPNTANRTLPTPEKALGDGVRVGRTNNGWYWFYQSHLRANSGPGQFHVGAVLPGSVLTGPSGWAVKTHKGMHRDVADPGGSYPEPTEAVFGGLDGANCQALENTFCTYFNGQNDTTSNEFALWHESGLVALTFGVDYVAPSDPNSSQAGYAGNATDMCASRVPGNDALYFFVPDESARGGISRWKVTGRTTIQVGVYPALGPAATLTALALAGPASLKEGTSTYYLLTGTYSDGTTADLTGVASYASSEGVFASGIFTLLNDPLTGDNRSVSLTATYNGLSATRTVAVVDTSLPPNTQPGTTTVRIAAGRTTGSPLATSVGTFALDQYFDPSPGLTGSNSFAIANTGNPSIYQGDRYDGRAVNYNIPVTNGGYAVTMHFAETYSKVVGGRIFDVLLQGATVIPAYDIFAKVGFATADVQTFNIVVTTGSIAIQLKVGAANYPKICGIEIVPLGNVTSTAFSAKATKTYPAPGSFTYETAQLVVRNSVAAFNTGATSYLIQNRNFKVAPGGWMVDLYMPAGEIVTFDRCVFYSLGADDMIHITDDSRAKFTNCIFYHDALAGGVLGPRAVYAYHPRQVSVKNCYFINTAGSMMDGWSTLFQSDADTFTHNYNRYDNICGDSGGNYRQMVQIQNVTERPGIEVAWNQVINTPGYSRVEDNINIGKSSGTVASLLHIHDNFIGGAYPATATDPGYTGSGITMDADSVSLALTAYPHNVLVEKNYLVGCLNAAMNIAAGYDILMTNNDIVTCAKLADGTPLPSANNGVGIFKGQPYSDTQFHNNRITGNRINYVPRPFYDHAADPLGPNSTVLALNDGYNTYATTATYADEQAAFAAWKARLDATSTGIGPL